MIRMAPPFCMRADRKAHFFVKDRLALNPTSESADIEVKLYQA
jgi:hypothetical protein